MVEENEKKPYHVGYVAGVFDLFHVGHLNLLRKSKELCDYLIVGVVMDEIVESYKGKTPCISLKDRVEIVKAIRYVDEVVVVDYHNNEKLVAQDLYQYDCHFSGDDYADGWKNLRKQLNARGVDLHFFKYTEGVSSTKLQEKLGLNYNTSFGEVHG